MQFPSEFAKYPSDVPGPRYCRYCGFPTKTEKHHDKIVYDAQSGKPIFDDWIKVSCTKRFTGWLHGIWVCTQDPYGWSCRFE